MTTKNIIESSQQKNEDGFKEAFAQAISEKVSVAITEMKIDAASEILGEGIKHGQRFTIKDEHKAEYPQQFHGWCKATSQMYRVPGSPHAMVQLAPEHVGLPSMPVPVHHIGKMMREEAESIDELSKGTLKSYVSKSLTDIHNKAYRAGEAGFKNKETHTKNLVGSVMRQMGVDKAMKKLTKEESLEEASFRAHEYFDHPEGGKVHLLQMLHNDGNDEWEVHHEKTHYGNMTRNRVVPVHTQTKVLGMGTGAEMKSLYAGMKGDKPSKSMFKEESLNEAPMFHVWDNEGKTADRYTVAHKDDLRHPDKSGNSDMLGMSHNPTDPQGVSMFGSGKPGAHLGKKIPFESLKSHLQDHIRSRYGIGMKEETESLLEYTHAAHVSWNTDIDDKDIGPAGTRFGVVHQTRSTSDEDAEAKAKASYGNKPGFKIHKIERITTAAAARPSTADHETVNESEVLKMPKFTHRVHYNFAENPLGLAAHDFVAVSDAHALRQSKKKVRAIAKYEGSHPDEYKVTRVEKLGESASKKKSLRELYSISLKNKSLEPMNEENTASHPELWDTHMLMHKSGKELKKGDKVKDFRGATHTITGFELPHHSGSTGRVFTKHGKGHDGYFFPSVVDAEIKKRKVVK